MMDKNYYITPEEYSQAAKNGIPKNVLEERIRVYNWTKERALTEPKKDYNGEHTKWSIIAETNGINKNTFTSRVFNGWEYERAATTPVKNRGRRCKND